MATYLIHYSPQAVNDLRSFRAFDRAQVIAAIELHLTHEPRLQSRSRIKQVTQPFWSHFRLRCGDFRVYYDVEDATERVNVLRIVEKGTAQTPEQSS